MYIGNISCFLVKLRMGEIGCAELNDWDCMAFQDIIFVKLFWLTGSWRSWFECLGFNLFGRETGDLFYCPYKTQLQCDPTAVIL